MFGRAYDQKDILRPRFGELIFGRACFLSSVVIGIILLRNCTLHANDQLGNIYLIVHVYANFIKRT